MPHEGTLQFADVTVDPATGNFLLRAIVPNPNLLLLPGMYVRAVINEGRARRTACWRRKSASRGIRRATRSALVVNKGGKVESRTVRVSRTIGDQWLVEEGLSAGDRVIVEGLQKVQPGMAVQAVEQSARAPPPDNR